MSRAVRVNNWDNKMSKLYFTLRNGFFAVITLGFMALTSPAQAMLLDFNFSFINTANGSGSGTVTGIIRGLTDNSTGQASSVEVLTNTDGFGIGEYGIGNPGSTFTVSSAAITLYDYGSFGISNSFPLVTSSTLLLFKSLTQNNAGLTNAPDTSNSRATLVTFSRVSVVPLPPAGILFGSSLVFLTMLRKRANKRAQA